MIAFVGRVKGNLIETNHFGKSPDVETKPHDKMQWDRTGTSGAIVCTLNG